MTLALLLDIAPLGLLRVGPLEAVDGTPLVDIKPVLPGIADA
jgi:tRNA (Thr-GGU) A37 N-methylase